MAEYEAKQANELESSRQKSANDLNVSKSFNSVGSSEVDDEEEKKDKEEKEEPERQKIVFKEKKLHLLRQPSKLKDNLSVIEESSAADYSAMDDGSLMSNS